MAEPLLKTAWVAPAYEAGGLDHLGVKAPIMHIYSDLLPGVTNVTDRLRYYSFYTWLIWSLDRREDRSVDALRHAVRHGDCLFTLIALFHGLDSSDDRDVHSAATVGNSTLSSAAQRLREGSVARLSTYAAEEAAETRYFKNRLGGLGQYYLGSLRDVLLLSGDGNSGIQFTAERGRPLAEAFDRYVDGERFWQCIDEDTISSSDLEGLASFCPCQLSKSVQEQESLSQILFALDDHVHKEKGPARRTTLQMMLNLASELEEQGRQFDVRSFRSAVYTGALPDRTRWQTPTGLDSMRRRWAAYVTNEVLSLGLQGLFFAVLRARLQYQSEIPVETARDMAAWFFERGPGVDVATGFGEATLSHVLDQVARTLPEVEAWDSEGHELTLATEVSDTHRNVEDDASITKITQLSVDALLALAVRLRDASEPYGELTFPPGYFIHFPLNLRSFQRQLRVEWREVSAREWLHELAADWCISAHIRVALRKLRTQSTATFQIKPLDDSLWVAGAPEPGFSSPRFYQARRILSDLGAIDQTEGEIYSLTTLGRRLMVASHD